MIVPDLIKAVESGWEKSRLEGLKIQGKHRMNERIKQLADEAGFMDSWFSESGDDCERELKKFAELIVRECVGVVEGGSFLHDQAPTAIFARECSGAIKRHFGVKE